MIGTLLKASCYFTNICSACTCSAATWLFATPCSLNHLPAPQKQKHTHECGRWALLTLGLVICNAFWLLRAMMRWEVTVESENTVEAAIQFWFLSDLQSGPTLCSGSSVSGKKKYGVHGTKPQAFVVYKYKISPWTRVRSCLSVSYSVFIPGITISELSRRTWKL